MNRFFSTLETINSLITKGDFEAIIAQYFQERKYKEYFYYKITRDANEYALQALTERNALGVDAIIQSTEYLRSVAKKIPEDVVSAILNNRSLLTGDVWATTEIIRLIKDVPPATARLDELVSIVIKVNDGFLFEHSPIVSAYGELILHLVDSGKTDPAFTLAKSLFSLNIKDNKAEPKFDIYQYDQIFKSIAPSLSKAIGEKFLEWTCCLLREAIEHDKYEKEKPEDNLFISRPNIENAKYRMVELSDVLISSVILACKELLKNGKNYRDLCEKLEIFEWHTFIRIMLYLLMDCDDINLIKDKLIDPRYFFNEGLYREYYNLLSKKYPRLDGTSQNIILQMIDEDKYLLDLQKRITLENERCEYLKRERKYKFLNAIKDDLDPEKRKEFGVLESTLKGKVGDVRDSVSQPEVMHGPSSPLSREELGKKSVEELRDYLGEWKPSDNFMSPSKEGLGRTIADLIADNPIKYASEVDTFSTLDEPIYLRSIFWGFDQALRKEQVFDWENVIKLMLQVVEKEDDPKHELKKDRSDDENYGNWSSVRAPIARLMYSGFTAKEPLKFQIEYERDIFAIIESLLKDKNPSVQEDEQCRSKDDCYGYAINTTRGKAVEDLVQYALWVREAVKKDHGEGILIQKGFLADDRLEKVKTYLDQILKEEKTLTVLAIFGFWLPWLVLLDKNWCDKNKRNIFPKDNLLKRSAVWRAYIKYAQPYNIVFEIFWDEYAFWVDHCDEFVGEGEENSAENSFRLLQHLVQFYWRTKEKGGTDYWFELKAEAGKNGRSFCFEHVFEKVPSEATAKLMGFVGRMLINEKSKIPNSTKERLKKLWDHRMKTTIEEPERYNNELNSFVSWFSSGVFDDEWSFEIMTKVFSKIGYPKDDYHLYEFLMGKVAGSPAKVLNCIQEMIGAADSNGLHARLSLNHANLYKILEELYAEFKNSKKKKTIEEIINKIGSLGQPYYSFGNILGFHVE